MINDIKKFGKCKNYLTLKIKIISSKDSNEKLLMHPESDSRDIMTSFVHIIKLNNFLTRFSTSVIRSL